MWALDKLYSVSLTNVLRNDRLLGSPAVINNPNQARSLNIHSFNAYDTNLLPIDMAPRRKIERQLFVPKNESERVIPYLLEILTDV
jgi:hypothetical protein